MGFFKDRMSADLELRAYRPSTRYRYLLCATQFVAFHMTSPDRLGIEHVRHFLLHLVRSKKVKPAVLKSHVAALKFLFGITLQRPDIAVHIAWPKVPRPKPVILSGSEVEAILNAVSSLRYRALFMTLYGTGLRIHEACALQVHDLDSKRMVIHVRDGKGGKDRYVMLPLRLLLVLRQYYKHNQPRPPYLFPGLRGRSHVKPESVRKALKLAVAASGVKKVVTPHLLRHAFATHMIEAGSDIRTLQLLLGHGSLRTTAGYIHTSRRHIRASPSPLDLLGTQAGERFA